jgi:predicted transcriptional regulator
MQLKEYLMKNRIDPMEFSQLHGISKHIVYRCLKGGVPHFKNAVKIEKATGGQVSVEEIMNPNEQ